MFIRNRSPRSYELKVAALSEKEEAYIRRVYDLFSSEIDYQIPEHDLFRMCFDSLHGWAAQLPVFVPVVRSDGVIARQPFDSRLKV